MSNVYKCKPLSMTPIAGGPTELTLSAFEPFFQREHEYPYTTASTVADDIGDFFPGAVPKGPLLLVPVKTEAIFDRYNWTQLEIKRYDKNWPYLYACLVLTSGETDSADSVVEIPVRSGDSQWHDERGEGILSIYLFSQTRAAVYEFPFPESAMKAIMEYERCPD